MIFRLVLCKINRLSYYAPRFCICNLKLNVIIELDEENSYSCHHQAVGSLQLGEPCILMCGGACPCAYVYMPCVYSAWHSSNLA